MRSIRYLVDGELGGTVAWGTPVADIASRLGIHQGRVSIHADDMRESWRKKILQKTEDRTNEPVEVDGEEFFGDEKALLYLACAVAYRLAGLPKPDDWGVPIASGGGRDLTEAETLRLFHAVARRFHSIRKGHRGATAALSSESTEQGMRASFDSLEQALGSVPAPAPRGAVYAFVGAPDSGLGSPGDVAIDPIAQLLYGPKIGSEWGIPAALSTEPVLVEARQRHTMAENDFPGPVAFRSSSSVVVISAAAPISAGRMSRLINLAATPLAVTGDAVIHLPVGSGPTVVPGGQAVIVSLGAGEFSINGALAPLLI